MVDPERATDPAEGVNVEAMEVDGLRKEVGTSRAALAGAATQEQQPSESVMPKGALRQCEPFSGKGRQNFLDWKPAFEAYQSALGTPRKLWNAALLTFVMVPALTILRAQFPNDLYQVGYDDLVHALEFAHLGKHETDFTLRTDLSRMRLKRGKGGRYNVSQLVHDFEAKLLMCKLPVDSVTACHWFLEALPASLRSRVATDALGQPWHSLEALRSYVLAVADAWERDSAHPDPSIVAPSDRNPKKGRYQQDTTKPTGHPDHTGKPSFVPGRTPQELNALRKRGACFKCGRTGHKASDCKAPASKSS